MKKYLILLIIISFATSMLFMGTSCKEKVSLVKNNSYPSWSPDGKMITFESHRDGNREIYIMNADGWGQTNLTKNPAEDVYPTWSLDGKNIIFGSDRDDPDSRIEIYVMNPDGSGQTKLTNNTAWDGFTSQSPDGKLIAFD